MEVNKGILFEEACGRQRYCPEQNQRDALN
jgi:hypothetical protein